MKRNKPPVFLLMLVGLAAIGLGASLVRNPGKFFIQIVIMIVIAYVLFKVLSYFLQRRTGETSDEMKKYRKAAKQSNERFGKKQSKSMAEKFVPRQYNKQELNKQKKKRIRRRNAPHLTVIEGKKSIKDNKNDQASN